MVLSYRHNFIPETRTGAYALLESVDFEPERLTEPQRQAIFHLYRLDDDRSVQQLIENKEVP